MTEASSQKDEDWWDFEPPPTAYDLVGNNIFTRFFRPLLYIFIKFYFQRFHRIKVSGFKKNYSRKSFILIANHSSHLDTPLIFSCFSLDRVNKIRAVAALDYFFSNPVVRVITHVLCNLIPINRKRADLTAIGMISKFLKQGGSIIIFPEGTRTRDGKIGEFKPGVGLLIRKTKAKVLPIYIDGAFECMNSKMRFPKSGPLEIKFGSPITYEELFKDGKDYEKISNRLLKEVIKIPKHK
jgi:1-acyl-sn-glycerol-3-phosphate acyltransferase